MTVTKPPILIIQIQSCNATPIRERVLNYSTWIKLMRKSRRATEKMGRGKKRRKTQNLAGKSSSARMMTQGFGFPAWNLKDFVLLATLMQCFGAAQTTQHCITPPGSGLLIPTKITHVPYFFLQNPFRQSNQSSGLCRKRKKS